MLYIPCNASAELIEVCEMVNYMKNIDATNKYGATALIAASKDGDVNTVNNLLRMGANPELKDVTDNNALTWASYRGHTNVVKLLVKAGAHVDVVCEGKTALIMATLKGHIEVVDLLINWNANRGFRDCTGRTAFDYAVKFGYTDCASKLSAEYHEVTIRKLEERLAKLEAAFFRAGFQ